MSVFRISFKSLNLPCKKRLNRGSTLLDVMLASFVLSLGAAAFYATFPTIDRSQRLAKEETVAGQMAQRMVEHLQILRPSEVTASNLAQLNLVDSGQSSSPYSFSRVPMDEASCYSPAQVLRNGTATLTISNMANGSVKALITISWTSASRKSRSFSTGTIIGGYK